ncbi:MAG: hypothetical protein FJY19_05590 [Bacteroidetes bacterium]|nr:hypothetical protein [Bacteroidota bacterium]
MQLKLAFVVQLIYNKYLTMLSVKNLIFSVVGAALVVFSVVACKKSYDQPAHEGEPGIVATISIKDLKTRYTSGAAIGITDDHVIEGVVACDDRSGNYYQQIAVQDATGGILLRLGSANLFNNYPVGRKLFIKVKGLYLGQYNGTLQLGGGVDSAYLSQGGVTLLAYNLFDEHLIKGALNQPIVPLEVSATQLTTTLQDRYISTLIRLKDMEFAVTDTGKSFADAGQSGNRIIQGCSAPSANRITLRTSNYSNFAEVKVPAGNGSIVGIYSYFGSTRQLTIRDTADVRFNSSRCGTGPTTLLPIEDLRSQYNGSALFVPNNKRITGVVISDRTTSNLNAQNIYLQQGTGLAGICVRFSSAHTFDLGDSIDINVSGQELSEYNGLLQLNNVPLGYATRVSTGKSITPRAATFSAIQTNFRTWESTLVKIINITSLVGGTGGRWGGSVTMTDATGTLIAFTSSAASFANNSFPGTADSFVGYLTPFNTVKQISFRGLSDVVAGSGPLPGSGGIPLTSSPYIQNFDGIATGLPQGISVKIGATATSLGTGDMPFYPATGLGSPTAWNQTSAGLKNFASYTGMTASSDAAAQGAHTNRALGIRQTSAVGYDPGAAYVFLLDNTTGKANFQLNFLLQSLDATPGGRTTAWRVEYGLGDNPSTFTAVTSNPATLITNLGTFGNTPVAVSFGTSLNNLNQKVWIRIITLSATTGSGNRPSSAIDDVQLSWN